jgi:hypothetical protein
MTNEKQTREEMERKAIGISENVLKCFDPAYRADQEYALAIKNRFKGNIYQLSAVISGLAIPIWAGYNWGIKGIVGSLIFSIPFSKFLNGQAERKRISEGICLKNEKEFQKQADSYDFSFLPNCKKERTMNLRDRYCRLSRGYEEVKKWIADRSRHIKEAANMGMYHSMIGGMNGYFEEMEDIKRRLGAIRYAEAELPKLEKSLKISDKVNPRMPFTNEDLDTILSKSVHELRSKEHVEACMRRFAAAEGL